MIDRFPIFDLHVHSPLSSCAAQDGTFTVQRIVREASRLGFDGICFTDHFRANTRASRMDRLAEQIRLIKIPAGLAVAVGMEAEIDAMPSPEEAADRFVLTSCNDSVAEADREGLAAATAREYARYLFTRTIAGVSHPLTGGIAHPLLGLRRQDGREVFAAYRDDELAAVCESARDRDVLLDMHRHFLGDAKLVDEADAARFFRAAARVGAKLFFGTDSHRIWQLASACSLTALARWIGLPPSAFISGMPAQ